MPYLPGELKAELNRKYVLDLLERVTFTFLQAFGAQLAASGFFSVDNVTDLSILQKAAVAGVAGVLSLVKGLIARGIGSEYTASTLPAVDDPSTP